MPAPVTTARKNPGTCLTVFRCGASRYLAVALLFVCSSLHLGEAQANSQRRQLLQTELQLQLNARLPESTQSQSDVAPSPSAIHSFYSDRGFRPAWLGTKRLMELRQLETLAELHGLNPDTYKLPQLAERINRMLYSDSNAELIALELQATESIGQLASHLYRGKVDYTGRYPELNLDAIDSDPAVAALLSNAAGSASLFDSLNRLAPDSLLYRKLLSSLAWHRDLLQQGVEWPLLPRGRTLEVGMNNARVTLVRQRLDAPVSDINAADIYDTELADAVRTFQTSHLLKADGVLGPRTLEALNVSIPERINQLRVNLDTQRWSSLPDQGEYLLVNIPHFKLHLVADGERIHSMRTQVGKRKRGTPVFRGVLESIIANPTWTVPPTIFREDVLPKVQSDPSYLQQENMYVVDDRGQRVDSTAIAWSETNAQDFPYRLRAKPGSSNALGRIKFQIQNPYLVYLHDTPSKHLFNAEVRAFSSGCIRLEQPAQLAEWLVSRQSKVGMDRLERAMAGNRTRYIGLDKPMPIIVMYATIDLDDSGQLVFAQDVYGNDRHARTALDVGQPLGASEILLAKTRTDSR